MPQVVFKAFLSCSFAEEDKEIVDFFQRVIKAFDIEPLLYDYQEIGHVPDKVKENIVATDCLIAIVTKRKKIEGSEYWTCPDWIQSEVTLANALNKPVAIFFEDCVSIEGLMGLDERRQPFARGEIIRDIDKITKFLFNLRNYLEATYQAEFLQGPVALRHYIHAEERIESRERTVLTCEILMESLIDELESMPHSLMLEDTTPDLTTEPEKFEFDCQEMPAGMKVTPEIIMATAQKFLWKVVFDPPLKRGERVKYAFETVRPNYRPYTYEEMLERINQGTYEYKEPVCEACEWHVTYPATELQFVTRFPRGYEIANCHPQVRIGEARLKAEKELARIKEGGFFEAKKEFFSWILSLRVPKPLQGHTYYTFYEPPKSA